MKTILVLGAGRSASILISYLLDQSVSSHWKVQVADQSLELAKSKINDHPNGEALCFDITNDLERKKYIEQANVVISLLPPHLHILAATACLALKKNLLTASYISPEMKSLDEEAQAQGVLFLNELGLDPGIDHMSAMQLIHRIQHQEGNITSFKSFCGGLVAPESDTNPWHFKFTWNPQNIVLAGKGTAKYKEDGYLKYIPYHQLFNRTNLFSFEELGDFEGYANRDSLTYIEAYGIQEAKTVLRGTLRKKGYCKSWNAFVQLGMTDESYMINNVDLLTICDFTNLFLPSFPSQSIEERFANYLSIPIDSEEMKKFAWLGLFTYSPIPIHTKMATPATILLTILEKKWTLYSDDRDMVIMQHQIEYLLHYKTYLITSSLVLKGENSIQTAMAKTVGLPLAIGTKLVLENKISLTGVRLPIYPEIYNPILEELKKQGIEFHEKEKN